MSMSWFVQQVQGFLGGIWRAAGASRPTPAAAQSLAQSLAAAAHAAARDPGSRTPWAVESTTMSASAGGEGGDMGGITSMFARMFPRGGKMDDVTVAVAFVTETGLA